MPRKNACNVIQIGNTNLVDATAMAALIGFSSKWVREMAMAGKIPWHGIRNGAKVYRRFDPDEVKAALAHGVELSTTPKPATPVIIREPESRKKA
jgi:hypothetical protein